MGFLDTRKLSIVRCSDDFYIFAALICLVLLPTAFLESWTEVFDDSAFPLLLRPALAKIFLFFIGVAGFFLFKEDITPAGFFKACLVLGCLIYVGARPTPSAILRGEFGHWSELIALAMAMLIVSGIHLRVRKE